MADGDLVTLATVQSFGNIISDNGGPVDTKLARLISASSARFQNWIGRQLLNNTYVDTFSGTDGYRRTIPNYPVTAILGVSVNDVQILQRPSSLGSGWVWTDDAVELSGYIFACGIKNCAINYVAGYLINTPDPSFVPELPADIVQAVIEMTLWKWKEKDRFGQQSKTAGNETIVFNLKEAPDSVSGAVETYRRRGWH